MDDSSDNPGQAVSSALLRALRPALPAVIGAAALTFLFAALMPMSWVAGIAWNLYLDRLSDYFVPPVGNAARLVLALAMAAIAAVLAGFIALLMAQPQAVGLSARRRRARRAPAMDGDDGDASWARRRRVDRHPDDPVRPPIRAGRDLPAGGLGPLDGPNTDAVSDQAAEADLWLGEFARHNADDLGLAAPTADDGDETGDEPWLQPAEFSPAQRLAPPTDNSLGAMVARLEAGLALRRQAPGAAAAAPPQGDDAPAGEPEVDVALEAALSTLQRMTRQSVG